MLPAVLATPPWGPRARARRILALDPSVPERLVLTEAERASWLDPSRAAPDELDAMPEAERLAHVLTLFEKQGIVPITATRHLSGDALRRAIEVSDWAFLRHYRLFERLLALEGPAALRVVRACRERAPHAVEPLLRLDSHVLARDDLELGLIARRFAAHPRTSARVLLAVALGEDGPLRDTAVRFIAKLERRERIPLRAAAAEYGADASEELEALWLPEPLPARAPTLPALLTGTDLPPVTLATGESLPTEAKQILFALLALLPNSSARALIDEAVPALDAGGLERLADALLHRWLAADAPPRDRWVLSAAGVLGGEEAARRFVELGEAWAKAGRAARARLAFEAVGEIGSDVALMHLDHLARTSRTKLVKKPVEAVLEAVCEERGWCADELSDRLVPSLGLEPDGFLHLTLGKRRVRVGLDETLAPVAYDDSGGRLPSLPQGKRVKNDGNPAEAEAFTKRVALLKKDAKVIAHHQLRRLERALGSQHRWSSAAFDTRLRRHPVMMHLARRLVWLSADGTSFRCVDDGTLATVSDEPWELPAGADVRIAHPLELGPEQTAQWSALFRDYQLLQPFPQLERETFTLTSEERASGVVKRFVGQRAEGSRFFTLEFRGWDFRASKLGKTLKPAGRATLATEPGLPFLPVEPEDRILGELALRDFDGVSDIVLGEVVHDVAQLLA